MDLVNPLKLKTSIRDWDNVLLALAKTKDGGSCVVVWRGRKKKWILSPAEGPNVQDVLKSPEATKNKLIEQGVIYSDPSPMSVNKNQMKLLKKLSSEQIEEAIDRGTNFAEEQAIRQLKNKKEKSFTQKGSIFFAAYEKIFIIIYNFFKKYWIWLLSIFIIIYIIFPYYIDYSINLILGTTLMWLWGIVFLTCTAASIYVIFMGVLDWSSDKEQTTWQKLSEFIGPILGGIFSLWMNYLFIKGLIEDGPIFFLSYLN